MKKDQQNEDLKNKLKYLKFIMFGISALTLISALSLPWNLLTQKEITLSLLSLLFVNCFLIWTYNVQFVWRQLFFNYLETKFKVIITESLTGYKVRGEKHTLTKLNIAFLIIVFYLIGVVTPLMVMVSSLFLIYAKTI